MLTQTFCIINRRKNNNKKNTPSEQPLGKGSIGRRTPHPVGYALRTTTATHGYNKTQEGLALKRSYLLDYCCPKSQQRM